MSTGGGRLRGQVSLVALVCAIALIPGPSYAAPNDPGSRGAESVEQIRRELDGLYRQAEVATEAYDAANEKATGQAKRLASLQDDLARTKDRVNNLHDLAGAAARTQYRRGDLSSTGLQLLLGDHSDHALDEAAQARQAMLGIVNFSKTQRSVRAELDGRTKAAAKDLRELNRTRVVKAGAKDKIEKKIAAAERIESGLQKEDARKLAQLERQRTDEAKSKWRGGGSAGGSGAGHGTAVSGAAGKAVAFATAQIGKPYVWGAVGPSSYDCSGLTSTAWAAAGHPIPRTSQAQWQGLTRVSLSSARPGDLIIYFNDATHVGMYIGGGQIIHAPRPGRTVTTAPAASMPILGVVRPGV